jgi:2-polyprenyl-3-methyl-5-hydroxy-6-metoxy-1,4-benzoquinol methylase
MNWEETIQYIRQTPKYKNLVKEAYFHEDLTVNVSSFMQSEEFAATLAIISSYYPNPQLCRLVDVGAGNGIAAVSFALKGYNVVAVEPDPSATIGAGAIDWLKNHYGLSNLTVHSSYCEDLPFADASFDVAYCRQTMHHAYHLQDFLQNLFRILKPNGLLLTTRDHVLYNAKEKPLFLAKHPLHQYYGGENAFMLSEYKAAIQKAGFTIAKVLGPVDTVINYAPWNKAKISAMIKERVGLTITFQPILALAWWFIKQHLSKAPGRLYSFLLLKPGV